MLAAVSAFWPEPELPEFPEQPRVERPEGIVETLGYKRAFATKSYWDRAARYVFVEPEKVREFQPVELDVPGMNPPKLVMPLPDPGPFLRFSDAFDRADGSKGKVPEAPPAGDGEDAGAGEAGAAGGGVQ